MLELTQLLHDHQHFARDPGSFAAGRGLPPVTRFVSQGEGRVAPLPFAVPASYAGTAKGKGASRAKRFKQPPDL